MTEPDIISEIEAYCAATKLKPSTVCVRATGSSRLIARLKRRAEQNAKDAKRIREFIAANPPPPEASRDEAAA
ncbi:hypothetical protein [Jannaschia formosa]|uniref:hypothetical protein n=1 Tax=Jannaschia formosa TaxID=2259592 RepID=UPI000E1BB0E3|nr:hypothetical protein [Jannaschia formosa]TFL16411.1 hypothetical protein DR046_20015 [Jannaschia formosa]